MLRWLRKIVNAMVVARLEELSHQVEEHHDEIHQPEYGIRPQLSNLRQRVAHLEGIHDRKGG